MYECNIFILKIEFLCLKENKSDFLYKKVYNLQFNFILILKIDIDQHETTFIQPDRGNIIIIRGIVWRMILK